MESTKWQCTGVKVCQYLDEQLTNLRITAVDEGLLQILLGFRGEIDLGEENVERRNANRLVTPL
jgi:hypothetical protein